MPLSASGRADVWIGFKYVRPSRRCAPALRAFQEALVKLHRREAALRRRHCQGCAAFLPMASQGNWCAPCARRARSGDTRHWWSGLRGQEKRGTRP
jgi:hypothetical protein